MLRSRSLSMPSSHFSNLAFMTRPPRVAAVKHLGGHQLRLTFSDGLVREFDFSRVLEPNVFAPLRDEAVFAQVSVDPVAGTIYWPQGIDFDPDVLHGDFEPTNGRGPEVLKEYRLRKSA